MLRKNKLIAVIVLLVLLGLGMGGFRVYTYLFLEVGYPSCLGSLHAPIWRQKATQDIANTVDDWKVLTDAEFDLVMQDVRGDDCKNFDDPKLDAQNNRINIAVRKANAGRYPAMIIWSNGRDEISGTDDDVVVPFDHRAPSR